MKQKHRGYGYLVLFLVLAVIVGSSFFFPQLRQFASPAFVREYLLGFGIFSYPLFILLVALSIPLPIPSTAIILGGGY
ncbi:MAG TPA: hypothetical protein VJG49_00235, partial [Candidatus Nanoarchaeia archaeon]|nr:hypothetical protein [Candidatus Nanoarchaeia archaeon]